MNRLIISLLLLLSIVLGTVAQRRVTPVEPDRPASTLTPEQLEAQRQARLVKQTDAKGRVVLIDTITGLEYRDTTATRGIPRMIYPTIYRVAAGINFWDAAMRCFGQKYGIGGVWGELNIHNRYFPYFEIGLGQASISPDGLNYRYRSPLAPYFKLGASYNIFYNSDSAYQVLIGLRYGLTRFKYSIDDVVVSDTYWDETSTFCIPSQSCFAGYFEIAVGVKVKLVGPLSAGWSVIFHSLLHESGAPATGKPIYFPGYGKRGGSFGASLSLIYSFDLNKPHIHDVEN